MKLQRDKTRLAKLSENDDAFVDASSAECVSFMWELTAEVWSLRGCGDVERRLQRNITNLVEK